MACSPLGNFLFERVGYHKNINETISKLNIEVPYSIQNILGSHNICLQREMMIAFLILFLICTIMQLCLSGSPAWPTQNK